MTERLDSRDASYLVAERPNEPRHNATVEIFEPGDSGFDHDRFVALVADRIAFVPRYRQRLAEVPGRLAAARWIDDDAFDLGYHVRRSALPRPGTEEQLRDLVSRIVSRPLDRGRPLWEIYFVEGLEGDRVAVLSKSHQALVDGVHTVDLGQLLLDRSPEPKTFEPDDWTPRRPPTPGGLVLGAVKDSVTEPHVLVDTAAAAAGSALRTARHTSARARTVAGALTGRRPDRAVVSGPLSQQRRIITLETRLADYRRIRDAHGGTINDVILATIAGGLRAWIMTRAESVGAFRHLRTVVPMSVNDKELEATSLGSQIAAHHVVLPLGEASPLVRLHQVSYSFKAHKETGRAVAANRIAGIAGFAPTTFHAIGSRVAADELRRGYHLAVTNVPGPQAPLYAAGAQMVATYPVPPLVAGHPLAIGVTSYDGSVFYGVTADGEQLPDVDVFATCLRDALDELLDTATGARPRAPRGRRKSADSSRAAKSRSASGSRSGKS